MRGRSHEQVEQVFTRGPRARGAHGAGAPRRVPIAVGGRRVDSKAPCPLDKVNRQFRAERPNQLWVSDFSVPQQAAQEMRVWPLAIGLQEQVANHHERLWSKALVVSVMEKVPSRHQVWINEDEQP